MDKREEKAAQWSELDSMTGEGKYFKPQPNIAYRLVFSEVLLVRKAFKENEPERLTAKCTIKTIDGEPSGKIWETTALSVIKTLRPYTEAKRLASVVFFLKKKMQDNRTSYVFEPIEPNVLAKGDDVAAYL